MLSSLLFLIITLAIYGFIKDLRNLHGKCLMAYVSSLTVLYITLIVNDLAEEFLNQYKISCVTIGYTFLTSLLCCFFWLNVMCYDIYQAFRYVKFLCILLHIKTLQFCFAIQDRNSN